MTDTVSRVIRTLGSGRTHVADVHPDQLEYCTWIGDFTGVTLPLATRCGAILRCRTGVAVCMKPGTQVRCPRCRTVTGIHEASADNTTTAVTA